MPGRRQLARQALEAALQVRRDGRVSLWAPVNVYDVAEKMGVKVQFIAASSLEGMYRKGERPIIFISAQRPAGRQMYTGAHELGHHVFGHGRIHIDEYIDIANMQNQPDPQEILAELFAGFLLMPKSAVDRAFAIRGWSPRSCTPLQAYSVAGWLGVGYRTLLKHMASTLRVMPLSQARMLERVPLSSIRAGFLKRATGEHLVIVDTHWSEHPIDAQVGDLIHLPEDVRQEGNFVRLQEENEHSRLFCATRQGIGRFFQPTTGWEIPVRVSRKQYAGFAQYRHMEDPDDD